MEVVLDGLRAEEELRGDVAVATAAGRELCDAPLLRRQLVERARVAGCGPSHRSRSAPHAPALPRARHRSLRRYRGPSEAGSATRDAASGASQKLAVGEMRSRPFERRRAFRQQPDALAEERSAFVLVHGCQCATSGEDAPRRGPGRPCGPGGEALQCLRRRLRLPRTNGCVDVVRSRPDRNGDLSGVRRQQLELSPGARPPSAKDHPRSRAPTRAAQPVRAWR